MAKTWAEASKALDGVEKKLRAIRSMVPEDDGNVFKLEDAFDDVSEEFYVITEDPVESPEFMPRIYQLRELFNEIYYEISRGLMPKAPSDKTVFGETPMEPEVLDPDDPENDAPDQDDEE